MRRQAIAAMLKGGDRRSIGQANEVKQLVLRQPRRFAELLECFWDEDPIVRMRAADAAEKVTVARPELLKPHKQELLGLLAQAEQIELRWHLAVLVTRLELSKPEGGACRGGLAPIPGGSQFDRENFCATGFGRPRPPGFAFARTCATSPRRKLANRHRGHEGARTKIVKRAEDLRAVLQPLID